MRIAEKLKELIFPEPLSASIEADMDWASLRTIYQLTCVMGICVPLIALFCLFSAWQGKTVYRSTLIGIGSGYILIGGSFFLLRVLLSKRHLKHIEALMFKVAFFALFSL